MRRQGRYIEYPEGYEPMGMHSMRDILGKAHRGELTPEQMAKLAAVQAEEKKSLEEWRKEHRRQRKAADMGPHQQHGMRLRPVHPQPGAP